MKVLEKVKRGVAVSGYCDEEIQGGFLLGVL